jgi:EpsD family peptidyl-prolyl cis-trans isomerase
MSQQAHTRTARFDSATSFKSSVMAIVAAALILAGCGGESTDKPASQTAAKVNSDEITVHQINAEIQRANIPASANSEAVSKRILEGLIDQQLLVQQATEMKLHRDPQVLASIESTRRQILAQAYLERAAGGWTPSADEIKAFYEKNPDLFQNRRVYSFRDFVFERSQMNKELAAKLSAAKTAADVGAVLKAANIRFREGNTTRPAEALPIEALPRIAKINKGDSIVFSDQNLTSVMVLLDYVEQGVALQQATPMITQFLSNNRKKETAQAKMKELRDKAKLEYVGNFAKKDEPAAKPAAEAPAQPAAPTEPAAAAEKKDDHIEKGVSGLRR